MTVESEAPTGSNIDTFIEFLREHPTVQFVRYQHIDMGGILRSMIMTKDHVVSLRGKPLKMSCINFAMMPHGTFNTSTLQPVGYDELWPDWRSLRLCTYSGDGRHCTVMCYVAEHSLNFPLWGRDPRTLFVNALDRARHVHGLEFTIGFEVEFVLMNRPDATDKIAFHDGYFAGSHFRDERVLRAVEDIVHSLQAAGIGPTHFHSEGGGPGMFEIPLSPKNPLDAVDGVVFAREAVRSIAQKHGMLGTLFPKPFHGGHCAVGAHVHISINNATDKVGDQFLAGVVENMRALCAFSVPNIDSYSRIGDVRGTMGSLVGYGLENKDVAIRKVANRQAYWEFRFSDCTANPYYALASWITAGCEGVKAEKPLPMKDPHGLVAFMSTEELERLGWTTPLPKSLQESVDALEQATSKGVLSALGREFLDMYIAFKRLDISEMKDKSEEERLSIYLPHF